MVIPIDLEKTFSRIEHLCLLKSLNKIGMNIQSTSYIMYLYTLCVIYVNTIYLHIYTYLYIMYIKCIYILHICTYYIFIYKMYIETFYVLLYINM